MGLPKADIGIFGGSGFYSFLEGVSEHAVHTPYGPPSDRLAVGELDGRRVAFLPRHGRHHQHPPHRINYRANLWAMKELGVRDRKSTRLELQSRVDLVCRLLLEKKK